MVALTRDDSPRGRVSLLLWEPPFTSYAGENGAPVRRAASSEVADLLADLVAEDVRTLAFIRSRRGAEQVAATAAELLAEVDPSLPGRVAAYRGGYLPEERRALEAALRRGDLMGLAATNALELGIDISGLDAVLIAGFPGTRAAFWQQVGRAGRGAQDALGVLVAKDDPLDTYLVTHPETLIGAPVEASVFDPPTPTSWDRTCAPPPRSRRSPRRTSRSSDRRRARCSTSSSTSACCADARAAGSGPTAAGPPTSPTSAPPAARPSSSIEADTGRVVGTVDAGGAHNQAHPGAVYVHQGETWLVEDLDLEHHVATMRRDEPTFSTTAREITDISIVSTRERRSWAGCELSLGEVDVSHQVVSFLRRRQPGGEVMSEEPLDLPERTLRTTAVWWTVPDDVLAEAGLAALDVPGAAHAAEHCSIGLLPLFATCDRWDIGGVSTARHADTGVLTVFVYDGHPGGAGFSERGFHTAVGWLSATREAIASCECTSGCPSCIQSPKCGNQNNPLDKAGAILLLDALLAGAPHPGAGG